MYVFEVRVTDKRFGGLNRMFEFFLNMRNPFVSRFICSKVVQVVHKCFERFVHVISVSEETRVSSLYVFTRNPVS